MLRQYKLKNYNFRLIAFLALISILGVLLVGSAEHSLQSRQMIGVIAGMVLMVIVSLMDYSWLLNFYWIIYLLNLGLLALVIVAGSARGGAARWIVIGGENGFQFQPTEIAKILLIMFFAMFLMKHENDLNTLKTIVKAVVLLLIPLAMVAGQPDLKNTITIAIIFCIMMYAAGLSYKIIGGVLIVAVPLILLGFFLITQTDLPIIDDYQKDRIMTFLNPDDEEYSESAMQQNNSVMAIGSGQLAGKGLNNNEVSSANKGNFVAEIQTDFIFAVAGEELGFVGCFGMVLLLFLIVFECIRTGRRAKDLAGLLICCGVASLVAVQSFINICVATGLMPNTGTPLPFVSYGLTSLISLYIGMGLVLNVGLQNRNYYGEGKANEYRIHRT
jgi:rod shape determining protein RodA